MMRSRCYNKVFYYNILKALNCKGKLLYIKNSRNIQERIQEYNFVDTYLCKMYDNHSFPDLNLKIGYVSIRIKNTKEEDPIYIFSYGTKYSYSNMLFFQLKIIDQIKSSPHIKLDEKDKRNYYEHLFFHSMNSEKLRKITNFLYSNCKM